MDLELARTFLEIAATGSFVGAARRLNVAQTTVSARVRLLEAQLGRPLFVRSKSGAVLTAAGEQFLRYAPLLIQIWERARHQVAVPPGRRGVLGIGGELSLWNPLLLRWLLWMRRAASDVALRTLVGLPDRLLAQVQTGVLDLAVMYAPQHRPGLKVELLFRERLVLVTTDPQGVPSAAADYVYVDWGPEFGSRHDLTFPERANPGLFVDLGPLGLGYVLEAGGSGYFRMGAVRPYLEQGRLFLVPDAPEFTYPAYAVYPESADGEILAAALVGLRETAAELAR